MTAAPEVVRDALTRAGSGPHSVTIGNFDGVHRGHQYLIRSVIDDAEARGTRSLVITFEPHPTSVLRPDTPFQRLTTAELKQALILSLGVDDVAVVPFTRDLAALAPDDFLTLVNDAAHPSSVYVGEGFRFGRGRSGDGETIRSFGERHGFETTVLSRLRDDDEMISSSNIRAALQTGDLQKANRWLGRHYRFGGIVEHGAARGRELGFPTANLLMASDVCVPADGIYAAYAHLSEGLVAPRHAMVYIGSRPTFDNGNRVVEVNILDFSGDLYTQSLDIELVGYVRADQKFDSPESLARQMHQDEVDARATLARATPDSDVQALGTKT